MFYDINLKTVSIPFISKQSSYNFSHLFSGSSTNNKELSVEEVIITGKCNIYESAFANWTNIKSIKLTGDINEIGVEAFRNCKSLTELIISPTVTKIGYGALIGCNNIETLSIPGTFVIGGVTSAKTTYFGALYTEKNKADRIMSQENVPTNIKEIIVTGEKCNDFLFNDCVNITNIKFADTITEIGGFSLSGCSGITNIVLSENLKKTAGYTFENCTSLKSITIPSSIEIIGDGTFKGCTGLTSIEIPNGVAKIERNTFQSCSNLTNIEIPNSVVEIGYGVFSKCTSLTNIEIPNSVTSIDSFAFNGCTSLKEFTIPSSVNAIDLITFDDMSMLENIYVDEKNPNYSSIDGVLFNKDKTKILLFPQRKKVKTYTIPDSVITIGYEAFRKCLNLDSVIIPKNVVYIVDGSFIDSPITILCEVKKPLFGYPNGYSKNCFSGVREVKWGYKK